MTRPAPPAGALRMALVRTQVASGQVTSVGTDAAADSPGVVAVITAADLPDGATIEGRPVLLAGEIGFLGQEVAAVVAESEYQAADAAAFVDVEYQAGTPASQVTNRVGSSPTNWSLQTSEDGLLPGRVGNDQLSEDGPAPDAGDGTVRATARQQRWQAAPLETRFAVATPLPDGGVRVATSAREPAAFAAALAAAAGLRPDQVTVESDSGRGRAVLVGDAVAPGQVLAVVAAVRTGRPVVWYESRTEDLTAGSPVAGWIAAGSLDVSDGHVTALTQRVRLETGFGTAAQGPGWDGAAPWYDLGAVDVSTSTVTSHRAPAAAGPAEVLARVVLTERLLTLAATRLGVDPFELRLRHARDGARGLLEAAVAAPADGTASAVALAPGVAASATVRADRAVGSWTVPSLTVALPPVSGADRALVAAAAVDGYGLAAMQESPFDDQENCLAATFMDYLSPTSWEAPAVRVVKVGTGQQVDTDVDAIRVNVAAAAYAAVVTAACSALSVAPDATVPGVLSSGAAWELAMR